MKTIYEVEKEVKEQLDLASCYLIGWTYVDDGEGLGRLVGDLGMGVRFIPFRHGSVVQAFGIYPDSLDGETRGPVAWGIMDPGEEVPIRPIDLSVEPQSIANLLRAFIEEYEPIFRACLFNRQAEEALVVPFAMVHAAIIKACGERFSTERLMWDEENYLISITGTPGYFERGEIIRQDNANFCFDLINVSPGFVQQLLAYLNTLEKAYHVQEDDHA